MSAERDEQIARGYGASERTIRRMLKESEEARREGESRAAKEIGRTVSTIAFMKEVFSAGGRITLCLLILATAVLAQRQGKELKAERLYRIPPPCSYISVGEEPRLEDYDTYRDYAPIDSVYMGFQSVNNQWVEGRVFLQSQVSFVGIVDANTAKYVEAFEGTTPIDGGHAFTADWYLIAWVSGWDGLIVQSPYGSWTQHVEYNEEETAVIRIDNRDGLLMYSLNGVLVFTQLAPGLAGRDLRPYYLGDFGDPMIGVMKRRCGLLRSE